jgi:2-alkenal reductase
MRKSYWVLFGALGCGALVVFLLVAIVVVAAMIPFQIGRVAGPVSEQGLPGPVVTAPLLQEEVVESPAPTPQIASTMALQQSGVGQGELGIDLPPLTDLYQRVNPGVVNIRVIVQRGQLSGAGVGSGFVVDDQGHIVTNNHVVAQATRVTAVFFDGTEVPAEIVGTDDDSDLAVLRVDSLPSGVHPLTLGDEGTVDVGDWVVAIGNPFQLGGSMTLGIVSALGRTIPSGATPFSIPQAVQTDAAINPGNSGGPLLDLDGQVIGVNAQIATGGTQANAGVGFAIPVSVVQRVVPALIEDGSYQWPWLGVDGTDVNLFIQEANDLDTQFGAYIGAVRADSPAAEAGLRGTTGTELIDDVQVPVGGDVVVAADGNPIADFSDLQGRVAALRPGTMLQLTVIRDGERQQLQVVLEARPETFQMP